MKKNCMILTAVLIAAMLLGTAAAEKPAAIRSPEAGIPLPALDGNPANSAVVTVPDAEPAVPNDESFFRVIVTDENGTPVPDVMVQFCDDTLCNIAKTDETGTATFDMPEGTLYEAHVLKVPEEYEINPETTLSLDVYSDISITLKEKEEAEEAEPAGVNP